jgi:DNA-binding beta-propeller fold protein YncE
VIATASGSVIATIPVGKTPIGVAAAPDGSRIYVTNFADIAARQSMRPATP